MGKQNLIRIFQSPKNILSIYLTAGYPKVDSMPRLIEILEKSGVDFIEAGMPYSDPLADGTTIQKSSAQALKNGMNLDLYFSQIKEVRKKSEIPILFMGYFNQILKTGIEKFLKKCEQAGIDGLVIPDLTPEIYQKKYRKIFEEYDLGLVFLIAPTTSEERIHLIDQLSSAFVYVVSSSATTGKTDAFGTKETKYFKKIAGMNLKNPLIIGFGIDRREKFLLANRFANGAIIGSAFIKALSAGEDYKENAKNFIEEIVNSK